MNASKMSSVEGVTNAQSEHMTLAEQDVLSALAILSDHSTIDVTSRADNVCVVRRASMEGSAINVSPDFGAFQIAGSANAMTTQTFAINKLALALSVATSRQVTIVIVARMDTMAILG